MKQKTLGLAVAALTAALAVNVSAADQTGSTGARSSSTSSQSGATSAGSTLPGRQDAQTAIRDWPQTSQNAANDMIQRYGTPDVVSDQLLVWKDKAPFRKIAVMRDGVRHMFPTEHQDVLSEEVNLQVPIDKVTDLARFDGSLIVDRTKGTVAARSDSEANNFLALNLANDIISGKRDVESARRFFADTAAKGVSGKSSDYTTKLLFTPKSDTADPGQSISPSGSSGRSATP